jgi:hypothetical protein
MQRQISQTALLLSLFCFFQAILLLPVQGITTESARLDISRDVVQANESAVSQLLPERMSARFRASGDRQFYTENLWEYINGAAESYHSFGFVALAHRDYTGAQGEVTVDVYDMGTPLNAFGIYAAERSPGQTVGSFGTQSYLTEYGLNFFQNRYYVKLSAVAANESAQPLLESLAQVVSDRIGGDLSLPGALRLLPVAGRRPVSERFLGEYPLGHAFLAPAMQAEYSLDGHDTSIVICEAADQADAKGRAVRLRDHFHRLGKVSKAAHIHPGAFHGATSFEGAMLFFTQDRYLIIVVDPPSNPTTLVEKILQRLKEAR